MVKLIRNPDVYHGENKKADFFEGWYFKLVQPSTGRSYCFIPGIFLSEEDKKSHSFIQILYGSECNFKYLSYDKERFKASSWNFDLKVGESSFSLNHIDIKINEQQVKIQGVLHFNNIIKWPDSIINPGSMGFYNYLSFMQCYSQVCAVDGNISGSLTVNGEIIDFTGGKVYIEKNWGSAFPYSYIWLQGNSFEKGCASVTCSAGHIPLPAPFKSFSGFLIGIYSDSKFYKFTSINKSTLSIKCGNNYIILKADNKKYRLSMKASYNEGTFMDLYAPDGNEMKPSASETLLGNLKVELYDKTLNRMIFKDNCCSSGIELSGKYKDLF